MVFYPGGSNAGTGGIAPKPRSVPNIPPVYNYTPPPRPSSPPRPTTGSYTVKPSGTTVIRPRGATTPSAGPATPAGQDFWAGGVSQGAVPVAPQNYAPPPTPIYSGSGSRIRGYSGGGGGSGGGEAPVPSMFASPAAVSAPTAMVQPPAIVNPAGAGANNVAGESFETIGQGQGTYGQEQRRRQARGPMTGLSITPEMLRRAAGQRLG